MRSTVHCRCTGWRRIYREDFADLPELKLTPANPAFKPIPVNPDTLRSGALSPLRWISFLMYMHVISTEPTRHLNVPWTPNLPNPAHHREQQRCHHYRHEQTRQNAGLKRGVPTFKCRDLIEQHILRSGAPTLRCTKIIQTGFRNAWGVCRGYRSLQRGWKLHLMKNMDKILDYEEYGHLIRRRYYTTFLSPAESAFRKQKHCKTMHVRQQEMDSNRWRSRTTDPARIKKLLSLINTREIWGLGAKSVTG